MKSDSPSARLLNDARRMGKQRQEWMRAALDLQDEVYAKDRLSNPFLALRLTTFGTHALKLTLASKTSPSVSAFECEQLNMLERPNLHHTAA